jgi:hypothetical protein
VAQVLKELADVLGGLLETAEELGGVTSIVKHDPIQLLSSNLRYRLYILHEPLCIIRDNQYRQPRFDAIHYKL